MNRFTIPRDVYFGDDALDFFETLEGKKAFIVIGSERSIENGTTKRLEEKLAKANIQSTIFCGVEHDPTVATVDKGAKAMLEYQPDVIISIGGGSPTDAAKAMWIFYEHPEFTIEEAAIPFNLPKLRKKAKFYSIPTTSGTATEVTSFSVVSDTKTDIKFPIADFEITPDAAIIDTTLVESLSPSQVANTGMDALTHAIEAYVSTMATPYTDAVAMKSIEMIRDNLYLSFNKDQEARKNMHIAQNLAGMAFSNAILGIVHSMAHKTGRIYGIPHGMANALYLSYVIEYNAKDALKQYAQIARTLGLKGDSEEELTASLVKQIEKMRTDLNLPHTLKEAGVDEKDFLARVDTIAPLAVKDPCTSTNPRTINDEQMKKLFLATYYGKKVDF
jgi:alcohol dehydrogenase class IV